jgi:antitoxin ParD1/3/4
MNVTLTPELEKLINDKVSSGLYDSAIDVVSDGLRLLAEQDRLREIKLAALRKDIEEGLNSGDSLPLDMESIKRIARERYQTS